MEFYWCLYIQYTDTDINTTECVFCILSERGELWIQSSSKKLVAGVYWQEYIPWYRGMDTVYCDIVSTNIFFNIRLIKLEQRDLHLLLLEKK